MSSTPYSEWYKDELVTEAKNRGLDATGNKADIIKRLVENDAEAEIPEVEEEAPVVNEEEQTPEEPAAAEPETEEPTATTEEEQRYTKVIAVGVPFETADWDASDQSGNFAYVVQEAINAGWRCYGSVTLDEVEPNPAAPTSSTLLTFSVPVVPANMAPSLTMSPRFVLESGKAQS